MTVVTLSPEQERFAADLVAQGRFQDVAEVVSKAIAELQAMEAERAAFVTSLDDAIAEGERDGFCTIEDVEREMDEVIEAAIRARG